MTKTPVSRRRGSRALNGFGPPLTRDVTIASGAHIPRIDLEALLRDAPAPVTAAPSLAGVAMTGGGIQTPAAVTQDSATTGRTTIALADGTQITFAAADSTRPLEPA